MTRVKLFISSLIYAITLIDLAGCATFDTTFDLSYFDKPLPKATATDPVVQILCMWQQAEGNDPDGRPCRGFNGQILFLSRRKGTPVQVEGDVRIYVFDDKGSAEDQSKPLHQFNFDHGSWKIHLTKSSLGATYNVFIPYTRRDVTEADCTLRVRLKPKIGPMVLSDFSNMPLTGHKKPVRGDDAKPIPTEEVEKMAADAMARNLLQSTTISDKKMKATDFGTTDKPASNGIQLASHEVVEESPKASLDSARLRQLEVMMQQMLANQINNGPTPTDIDPPARIQEPPRLSEAMNEPSERLKLVPKQPSSVEKDEPNRIAPVRKAHPLDDVDKEPRAKSSRSEKRPRSQDSPNMNPFESGTETTALQPAQPEVRRFQRSVH